MRIKRRRVAYTFTLPAQVNIDIDVGSEARKLKKKKCIAKLTERDCIKSV